MIPIVVDNRDVRQRTWISGWKSWTGELAFQSYSKKTTLLGTARILTKVLALQSKKVYSKGLWSWVMHDSLP